MTSFSFMVFLFFICCIAFSGCLFGVRFVVFVLICSISYVLACSSHSFFFVCIAYFFPWLVYRPIIRRPTFFVLALLAGPFFLCM